MTKSEIQDFHSSVHSTIGLTIQTRKELRSANLLEKSES